jgi:hypothetical protein
MKIDGVGSVNVKESEDGKRTFVTVNGANL